MLGEDQKAVLKSVIDRAALIASALGTDIDTVEVLLKAVDDLFAANLDSFQDQDFVLSVRFDKNGGTPITLKTIKSAIGAGTPLIFATSDFGHIKSQAGDSTLMGVFARSKSMGTLEIVWHGFVLRYIVAGQLIDEQQLISPKKKKLPAQEWIRPFSQLSKILNDHLDNAIQYEKEVRYWKDKSNRILLAGADGTEKIFHGSLFWWLNNFVEDKVVVFGQTYGFGQDSTDISIVTASLGTYLVEVKWLGKNENGTEYKESQINAGLVQVKTYLKKNTDIVEGYLVVYDGRSDKLHKTECRWLKKNCHKRCRDPYIFFLESLTPSQIAKQAI